ncbi:MAG TPA: SBBP repeat-containing protein [Bryobacteraceae bacterium]|nr:SBBP repeat-containing protein [Bryobacteraceae bacterium]
MHFNISRGPRKLFLALLAVSLPLVAASNTYGKLPLSFEPNQGQTDARVKFLSRASGYTLFVTAREAVFASQDGSVERMTLMGANLRPRFEPLDKQSGISNYFIGNDPLKWRTNITNYGKVALRDVYPGIDLVFYGNERQLEYDWIVAPGADPKLIHVKCEGPSQVTKNASGDLVLSTSLVARKPFILQEGKRIEGGYSVRGREVTFELAKYDAGKPLVIDPVLLYSTYLGGSGVDQGRGIAVDGAGNAYVTGFTSSLDFPAGSPIQVANAGGTFDAFVTKINAAGSARVYSTYLGGEVTDQGTGIAVDGAGNAYVTGYTNSFDFPTRKAIQSAFALGAEDAFVTKIDAAGSTLLYSTYLGGGGTDLAQGIAVDSAGNAYVTGYTNSNDFPTASPMQSSNGGNGYDAFVTKINAAGSAYVYSTYLGGSGDDFGQGIAVDSAGNAYATGFTYSTNFPTTNALQPTFGGFTDVFVTKINAAGSARVYSTYLGGSGPDVGQGIAVDGAGNAYVTGYTLSTNFPTNRPLQNAHSSFATDAFVSKINTAGSALVYSTYVGGSGDDRGAGIAVDKAGNAYVTGSTGSTDFPTTNPVQMSNGGGLDAFATEINAAGSAYVYSTYVGGNGDDFGAGIAVDGAGNAYVTGTTGSANFPTANPAQASYGTFNDAFVLSISAGGAGLVFPGTHFVPVTPCRLADTRNTSGPFGGPAITGGTTRDFVVPNGACGIPSNATAYSLNVAVVPRGPLGFLTLWPSGQSQPLAATLNSVDGRVKSNAAIVPAGSSGAVSVFATDTTDVVLDINGYFVAGSNPTALAFYPLTPCRVADTRNATTPLGGPSLAAQSTRSFPIPASSCGLPANAQAYSLNFAAIPKGLSLAFLTAWPVGQQQPLVASLNDATGTVLSNAVIVPAGFLGAVNVFATDATDLVIDINGYFAPQGPGGLSLYTVTPCRVLDSRLPAGSPPISTTRDVNVTAASCGVPVTAQAFVFNATVVPPGPLGYITMWPQGQTQPLAATLNAYDGAVTNNMAIVPTTTGSVSVFPSAPTHLVLDIFGYFAP